MTTTIASAPAAIRAFPYVDGESRRFKAEPTKLTPLASKIMLASGALTTRRKAASFPRGSVVGGIALLAMTAAFLLIDGPNSVQTQKAEVLRVETPAFTVGVADPQQVVATETRAERTDFVSDAGHVANQDRFEINRFIRLSSAVRHEQAIQYRKGNRSTNVSAR